MIQLLLKIGIPPILDLIASLLNPFKDALGVNHFVCDDINGSVHLRAIEPAPCRLGYRLSEDINSWSGGGFNINWLASWFYLSSFERLFIEYALVKHLLVREIAF